MRKTKIICTLGPSVDSDEKIEQLICNGMDCARFNFSHGTHEEQKARMDRVKRISSRLGTSTALMLDTKGPEIRVKDFKGGSASLKKGQMFVLDTDEKTPGDDKRVGITYHQLADHVSVGTRVLVDDGKLTLKVSAIEKDKVVCTVQNDATLTNHKSINLPGVDIPMPYLSAVDRSDILFGVEQQVDFIAASFVRSADDVRELRQLLRENGGEKIKIISKIENTGGLDHFDEILAETDGVMVARGDLGVEVPFQQVPAIQKKLIAKCIAAGVFVVTATQMLESMIHAPRPTRAEVSDVANAVYDGTTIIMLSGETAAGEYPVEAVQAMAKIAEEVESSIDYNQKFRQSDLHLARTILDSTCSAACAAAEYMDAKAIVAVTKTGRTSARLADFYPACPIIAGVISDIGRRQMNLAFNVHPVEAQELASVDELVGYARLVALSSGIVEEGDTVVIVTGNGENAEQSSDTLKIEVL
jgi:pyruvate kinase